MDHRNTGWLSLERARSMRADPTPAEATLWSQLRRRSLGVRFRRQEAIGPYIVDFVCIERRLIVEVDGDSHDDPARDKTRDNHLNRLGFSVLHIDDSDVYEHEEEIVAWIWNEVHELPIQRGS